MKIIFVHHAHRKKDKTGKQLDKVTNIGKQDIKTTAKIMKAGKQQGINFKAVFCAPTKRHIDTAKAIGKRVSAPVFTDNALNEKQSTENWLKTQVRVRNFIGEILHTYKPEDAVVCVTSGVNVVAFLQIIFKLKPSPDAPFIGVPSCSPLVFDIDNNTNID